MEELNILCICGGRYIFFINEKFIKDITNSGIYSRCPFCGLNFSIPCNPDFKRFLELSKTYGKYFNSLSYISFRGIIKNSEIFWIKN